MTRAGPGPPDRRGTLGGQLVGDLGGEQVGVRHGEAQGDAVQQHHGAHHGGAVEGENQRVALHARRAGIAAVGGGAHHGA
ncbi:MAG: hypothetical protein ABIO70_09890, partial [Pseudomonadota bacterium]